MTRDREKVLVLYLAPVIRRDSKAVHERELIWINIVSAFI